ncbi:hypothetical protein ACFVQ3_18355 [Oerskovia sp. NPDC057915]|uniref:hypothetical protein n=1 Tax=Oerskovia sp. NPDC057915 TaxID=3346280 RepID=UPI0036D8241D
MNDKIPPSTPLHLDAALSDIATDASRAVSDGLTGSAEVHRLIKRSRRQRAAAFGSAGFVLLGVAGIGLSGVLSPAPVEILPAPPVPSPTPEVVEPLDGAFAPACGDDLSDLLATTTPVALAPGGSPERPLVLDNTGESHLAVTSDGVVALYLLDAEGKVASLPAMPTPPTDETPSDRSTSELEPGASAELATSGVGACDGSQPPTSGTYTAMGFLTADLAPAGQGPTTATVAGGPWIVTTDEAGRLTSIDGHAVAVEPVQPVEPETPPEAPEPPTYLPGAFGTERATFPAPRTMEDLQCGSPAPAPSGDDLLARLEVVGRVPVVDATSQPSITARVTTHAHARLNVVDWSFLYEYVISQDGVIVSSPLTATDSYEYTEMQPGAVQDGRFTLAATGACDLYGTSAPQPLPPGTYQLHAVYPWLVDSYALQQTDGTWGRTIARESGGESLFKGILVSAPVTFTVR